MESLYKWNQYIKNTLRTLQVSSIQDEKLLIWVTFMTKRFGHFQFEATNKLVYQKHHAEIRLIV